MRPAPSAPRRRGASRIPLCVLLTLGVSAALLTGVWTLRAAAQDPGGLLRTTAQDRELLRATAQDRELLRPTAQGPGGLRLNFGISQSFEAETNQRLQLDSPGTAVTSTTRLDFGLRSETRAQSLRLGASLPLRLSYAPDDTRRFVVERPDLDFTYSRFAPRADFTASGSLRTEDLRFVRAIDEIVGILDPVVPVVPGDPVIPVDPVDPIPVPDPARPPDVADPADPVSPLPPGDLPDDEELDDIDLIDGRGTRQRIRLDSRLRLGLGGPVTTTLRAGLRETRYSGDVNPGLRDSRRLTFGVATALRLTPVTEATVNLLLERFERDDEAGFRRDTRRLGFGLRHEVTQTLTARANLGFGWVESRDDEDLLRRRRGVDAGLGFDLALPRGTLRFDSQTSVTDTGRRSTASLSHSLPMPNGTLSLAASARRLDDGTRLSFTVGRNMDLRRGPLSASVGLTRSPGGSWGTIGRVNYREALPRGSWRVSLLQGFTLDEEDRETRRTIASAGYTHDINRSSRVTLDAAFSRSPTTDAARFRATYSRDVTPDWSLNLGYRYDNRSRTGGRAESHSVFLTFGRSFDIGL